MKAIKYQGRIWIPSDRAVSAELPIPDLDEQAELITELKRFEKLAMSTSRCPDCGTGIVGYCLGCKIKQLEAKVENVRENGNRAIENLWKTITDKDEQIKQLKENQCCLNCMYYNTDGCTLSGPAAEMIERTES